MIYNDIGFTSVERSSKECIRIHSEVECDELLRDELDKEMAYEAPLKLGQHELFSVQRLSIETTFLMRRLLTTPRHCGS